MDAVTEMSVYREVAVCQLTRTRSVALLLHTANKNVYKAQSNGLHPLGHIIYLSNIIAKSKTWLSKIQRNKT